MYNSNTQRRHCLGSCRHWSAQEEQYNVVTLNIQGMKSKDLKNLSDLLDTHQAQPTEVRHQTRSRSSPLPGHETQTLQAARVTRRGGSKRLHFRASRT
ncbi:Nucleic acid-binding OB-fold [Penicillium frequentans]|nr:Nucleic acid-binding OB-fold [Penicillium glabrum]